MQSALDIGAFQLELLKSLEPELVAGTINRIVSSFCQPQAVAVLLWDPDFEAYSSQQRYFFGEQADELSEVIAALEEENGAWTTQDKQTTQFNTGKLAPLLLYRVERDEEPVGAVVVAGDASFTPDELQASLGHYPLSIALGNCFEFSELKREVERLRNQYELLELDLQEERRMAALNGGPQVASPGPFRLEQMDKEKLVYEISNAVRSSLDVQEVLQTAVTKIGQTFELSRCLVIWPQPEVDAIIFEYHDDKSEPVKELFGTQQGLSFVTRSSEKTAPHDFFDDNVKAGFDPEFLKNFGFLSGMLVPLIYQDRNIGSLFLQDCLMPREWSIDNTALIGSLADLITVAIEHANMHEEKKRQAVTDGLTGIANRRHFNETLIKEFERAKRYNGSLSLVVVDMDYLKKINDTYGHHVGDEAIKAIGNVLSKSCRSVDLAARFGGEEFCLLLPDTAMADAMNLAERVRKLIEQTEVPPAGSIAASIGVATYPSHGTEPQELFEAADQALYAAKQGGRNRVVSASSLPGKQ